MLPLWLIAGGFMGKEGQQVPPMDDAFVHSVTDRYVELYERITGQAFRPAPTEDSNARVQRAGGSICGSAKGACSLKAVVILS